MNDSATNSWLDRLDAQLPDGAHEALERAYSLVLELAKSHGVSVEPLLLHAKGVVEILLALHVRVWSFSLLYF